MTAFQQIVVAQLIDSQYIQRAITIAFLFAAPLVNNDGTPATPVLYQEEIKKIKNEIMKDGTVLVRPLDLKSLLDVISTGPPILHLTLHATKDYL